ncbi:hypothetical protein SAMN05216524_11076 [Mucilaginibacter sp. OK098]|nr:hypothetical protein SAMN05216524_11076 [Mucilaginibacter sp. OK098]
MVQNLARAHSYYGVLIRPVGGQHDVFFLILKNNQSASKLATITPSSVPSITVISTSP